MRTIARCILSLGLLVAGCAPALDWRTAGLPNTDLLAELPCRSGRFERTLQLGPDIVKLFMMSCEASDMTFGLSTAELADAARVEPVLAALLAGARAGIGAGGTAGAAIPWQPAGATPYRGNVSARFSGTRPDGAPVEESIAVFGRGRRVYEAIVIGRRLDAEAVDTFRDALAFPMSR